MLVALCGPSGALRAPRVTSAPGVGRIARRAAWA